MEPKLLYRIYVRGRVQGVGYRWNAANEAVIRGINGYVRNMSDGSVFIEAEGPREMLDDYVRWCRRGPSHSYVESVDIETAEPVNHTEFRIHH